MSSQFVLKSLSFSVRDGDAVIYNEYSNSTTRPRKSIRNGKSDLTLIREVIPGPGNPHQYVTYDQYVNNQHVVSPTLVLTIEDGRLVNGHLVFHEGNIDQPPIKKYILPIFTELQTNLSAPRLAYRFNYGCGELYAVFQCIENVRGEVFHFEYVGLYAGGVQVTPKTLADKTCPLGENIKKHLETESQKKFELPVAPLLKTLSERPCTLEELQAAVVELIKLCNKQAKELQSKQDRPWRANI